MIRTLIPPSKNTSVGISSPRVGKTVIRCTATAVAETRRAGGLYEVLRVKRNASAGEIKSAYRSLAKVYHPDLSAASSSAMDFMKIHKAYETLIDPSARAMYDSSLCAINNNDNNDGRGGGERRQEQQQPFRYSTVDYYYTTTRNWETDQCW